MKREETLRGRTAFRELFRRGQRVDGTYLRCLFLANDADGTDLHVGFAVPRATGKAVTRNRLRRLMREAFRQELPPLLAACHSADRALTMVFLFRGRKDAPPSRVRFQPVHEDVTVLCRAVAAKL